MTLNWRHKAGLLLALTATGLSLFFELSAKQTAGVAVLGIALAWFAGSVPTRILGWVAAVLSCLFGLYIALAPLGKEWMSVQESAAEYDSAMAALHSAVRNAQSAQMTALKSIDHAKPPPSPPPGFTLDAPNINVEVPESVQEWERSDSSKSPADFFDASGRQVISFPGDASDKEIMEMFQTQILRPRPGFVLPIAIKAHLSRLLGGTLLFAVGLIGIWLLTRLHGKGRVQSRAV